MKLSIITINLNNASGLRKTIESVVNQTFTDFEYIIIDGGSTDGSVDLIREYQHRINYWVSEPDKGIYNAMNKGIVKAKGEYLQFLNSGDRLYCQSGLWDVLSNKFSVEIVTANMQKIFPDKSTQVDKGQAYQRKQENKRLTLYDLFNGTINHSCSFIKRELFQKYGLYDESLKIVSDWKFFLLTVGLNNVKVEHIDIIVSEFDMTGISNQNEKLLLYEREKVINQLLPDSIRVDYLFFNDLNYKYEEMKNKFDFFFHYRFTLMVTKLMNKILSLLFRN